MSHDFLPLRRRRGNAQITAIMFGVILGFGSLSVDIGMVRVAEVQIQTAVEAGALGGSGYLDGTNAGAVTALQRAEQLAESNELFGAALALNAGDVQVGNWHPVLGFTAVPDPAGFNQPELINAVLVTHTSNPFASVLAGAAVMGIHSFTESGGALSIRRGGPAESSRCWLPLAVPDCHVQGLGEGQNPMPMRFEFSSSNEDGIAWALPFDEGNANANTVRSQFTNQCNGSELAIGDDLYTTEGELANVGNAITKYLNNLGAVSPKPWPSEWLGPKYPRDGVWANDYISDPANSEVTNPNWGNVIMGPIALVDAGDDCENLSFVQTKEITGFTWGIIFDINQQSDKNIWLQLDYAHEHEIDGDVGDGGTGSVTAVTPPLLAPY